MKCPYIAPAKILYNQTLPGPFKIVVKGKNIYNNKIHHNTRGIYLVYESLY